MIHTNSRFLFIVEATGPKGADRLTRCLFLANALADFGGACTFMASPAVEAGLSDLAPGMARAPVDDDGAEQVGIVAAHLDFDAVVFDHPGLRREDHAALSRERPSVVLDDLASGPIGGRIVVNPALAPPTYQGLALEDAEILVGPMYALMAGDYARLRAERMTPNETVRRVALSVGSATPVDLVARLVDLLRPRLGDACLDLLLPGDSANLRGLTRIAARDPRLALHGHPLERPRIAARADIAITTMGPALMEACALGQPIIAIGQVSKDDKATAQLREMDAAIIVDATDPNFEGRLERAFVRLVADPSLRRKLCAGSAGLTDGAGAARIAQKLIGLLPR